MGTRTIVIASTSSISGSFTLPIDYDATANLTITCIGAGGGGGKRATLGGAGGGGGGALARGSFSGLKPGQVIYYSVPGGPNGGSGAGAVDGTTAADCWVNISSNAAPTANSAGVLAKAGAAGLGSSATGGNGGAAASCIGNVSAFSGGNGGAGSTSGTNGAGGGGGGSSARWTVSLGTFGTGFDGGNGSQTAADGGGGGGGGVLGAGGNATTITGAAGGIGFASTTGGTSAGAGTTGPVGGGGGGGAGRNVNSSTAFAGGSMFTSTLLDTGQLSGGYGWTGGGGGGGGGTNNSASTGGAGGAALITATFGGGGGGGGGGLSNGGGGGAGGSGGVILQYTTKTSMLPTTNLAFGDIQTYFGGANPISLDEYYRGGTLVNTIDAQNSSNVSIPASGQIAVSNFRGAPFKLYKIVRCGNTIIIDGIFNPTYYGFSIPIGVGSIDSNTFTLSGGAGVAITELTWWIDDTASLTYFHFTVSSTSAVTNTGWEYIIISSKSGYYSFKRTDASFSATSTAGQWVWSALSAPLIDNPFDFDQVAGVDFPIYFV